MIFACNLNEMELFEYYYSLTTVQDYKIAYIYPEQMAYNYFTPTQELLDKYCLWVDLKFWECSIVNDSNDNESKDNKGKDNEGKGEENIVSSMRIPKIKLLCFQEHLQNLVEYLDSFATPDSNIFERHIKKSSRRNASSKRTQYFGVNKNGPNWQTLISINRRKTYVGTFMSEVKAARAYDFYSMLVHLDSAKTNFNYNKIQAIALVSELSYLVTQ